MANRRASAVRARRDEQDESEERRPYGRNSGPSMMPIVAVVLLIGGGMGIAGWISGNKAEAEETGAPVVNESPFASIAAEEPPTRSGSGSSRPARRYTENAPEGVASDPTWIEATRMADEASALEQESWTARDSGDFVGSRKMSNEAKLKIDQAITMTTPFLDGLIEKYGETDRQVSKIRRTQNDWGDLLRRVRIK